VICGETKATKEHVWPKWILKLTGTDGEHQIGVGDDPANWRSWTNATFPFAPRILCEPCNNRLGRLEGWAALLVPPMVQGQARRLIGDEQADLARWFYKTGLMIATTHDHLSSRLPTAHYADLKNSLDLPPASMAWIGRVDHPVHRRALWVQRFVWHDSGLANAPPAEGYSLVLTVRDIVSLIAVLDTRQSPGSENNPPPFHLGALGAGKLNRIWPSSDHYGVPWPPSQSFTSDEVRQLAKTFERAAAQRRS
jgi:hypothetical protein